MNSCSFSFARPKEKEPKEKDALCKALLPSREGPQRAKYCFPNSCGSLPYGHSLRQLLLVYPDMTFTLGAAWLEALASAEAATRRQAQRISLASCCAQSGWRSFDYLSSFFYPCLFQHSLYMRPPINSVFRLPPGHLSPELTWSTIRFISLIVSFDEIQMHQIVISYLRSWKTGIT